MLQIITNFITSFDLETKSEEICVEFNSVIAYMQMMILAGLWLIGSFPVYIIKHKSR